MTEFARLYLELDRTTKTNAKVEAMAQAFRRAEPADAAWMLAVLTGWRPKRLVGRATLRAAVLAATGLPEWLWQECYDAVGDSAETIALLLPDSASRGPQGGLAFWMESRVLPLGSLDPEAQAEAILAAWAELDRSERFAFNKLLTGALRVGVARELVIRAVSQALDRPPAEIAHHLMGGFTPSAEQWHRLRQPPAGEVSASRPYPFALAHALEDLADLGDLDAWQIEPKWDGIRAQLIRRSGQTFVWSRGEDLVGDAFPEIVALGDRLPEGTVLDGEILAIAETAGDWPAPRPFTDLQRRLNRKAPGKKLLSEVPVGFVAFDALEIGGDDLRETSTADRRAALEALQVPGFMLSPVISTPADLEAARAHAHRQGAEGLMLKRRDAPYPRGRKSGVWWKWKVAPFTVDAVLVYAQRGSGRRASLYTDYTFAVWSGDQLVPFAKAYSGLTDGEIREVDAFVRQSTTEKFGPVRTVTPTLVFEIAFEGIQLSNRHKSGVAVRFPRILRWRRDKRPADAEHLEQVHALLRARNGEGS